MDEKCNCKRKCKTLRNIHVNFYDLTLGQSFFHIIPKNKQQKKNDNLDSIEMKTFVSKNTITKVKKKKQPTEWKKISVILTRV